MKQKDIALIIVIIFVSGAISLFVSKTLFSSSSSQQQAEVVEPINSNFPTPSSTYFNTQSVDPMQTIQIGSNNNSNPFNGSSQQ